jgi:hypothetical protein
MLAPTPNSSLGNPSGISISAPFQFDWENHGDIAFMKMTATNDGEKLYAPGVRTFAKLRLIEEC